MKTTSKLLAAAALSLATVSGTAFAQSADIQAGATVYGPEGSEVGTIDKVEGGVASLNTGSHVVGLPLDKFGTSEKGPTIAVTKAQLDDMAAQAEAQAAAQVESALVSGASVVDANGAALGTIGKVEGDSIVLETADGPVSLTRKYFTLGQGGALTALVTKEQVAATLQSTAQAGGTASDS